MLEFIQNLSQQFVSLWNTYNNQDLENYLSQSQNTSDLEERMRTWENRTYRNGTFFLS
jgi:hypothetical protein